MKYVSPVAELVAIEAIEVLLTSACDTQTTCPNYVPGCEEDW